MASEAPSEQTYTLYRRGIELLEDGDFEHAAEPLAEAARRAPEKASVREALGRAYYRAGRFAQAAVEFEAVVETHHVDDYAHFCLGRALSKTGQKRARPPPPGAGLEPAPGPARLPLLPPPARRLSAGRRLRGRWSSLPTVSPRSRGRRWATCCRGAGRC